MDKQEEQIKKLWEWCGFKHERPFAALAKTNIDNPERFNLEQWYIRGVYCGDIPELTLDNIFKYAVPNFYYVGLDVVYRDGIKLFLADVVWFINSEDTRNGRNINKEPEVALLNAMCEVIDVYKQKDK